VGAGTSRSSSAPVSTSSWRDTEDGDEAAQGNRTSVTASLIALNEHQPKVKESVMMLSNSTRRAATSVTGALLIALGAAAFAGNPPASAGPTPTKAMREKMAVLHQQM